MDTDRNLLFGVLALQADLIDNSRFAQACALWARQKERALADVLVAQGWLTPDDRDLVESLLARKLQKYDGDAHAGLAEVTTDSVRRSLAGLDDADVHRSLGDTRTDSAHPPMQTTTAYVPEKLERYTLSRLHATGGIGRVWLARDASLGRDVALKELRPDWSGHPAALARFLREAQITGQLEHPGVVPIYEVGRRPDDTQPYYTMRFVRGRTLAEAVASYHQRRGRGEAGPLELRERLGNFVGVCNAVAYAHSRGVLHRDLKPQNVVLGDFGEVIVLDWGLARAIGVRGQESGGRGQGSDTDSCPLIPDSSSPAPDDLNPTQMGQVLGTPAYMAPEQAEGRLDQLGPATDVYGLGAVLYEVLTGRPPFAGQDTAAVLRQVIHEPPVPPRFLVPALPRALEAICLRALAKRPSERYAGAQELAADVQRWLADEPVSAYREPWAARLGRWGRRHRPIVATAAAVLLTAVVALGVGSVRVGQEQARTEREREQAVAARNEATRLADLARRAEGVASRNAGVAAEQRQLALEGFRVLVTSVQEQLADQPGTRPLKQALLTTALRGLKQVAQSADRSAVVDLRMAQARDEMVEIFLAAGQVEQAGRQFDQGRAIAEKLVADDGSQADARRELAVAYFRLGVVRYRSGQGAAARELYEKSREQDPKNTVFRQDLYTVLNNLGDLYLARGAYARARDVFQRRLEECRFVADRDKKSLEMQRDLSLGQGRLADALKGLGEVNEAVRLLEEATARFRDVVRADPDNLDYERGLGSVLLRLGMLLEGRSDIVRAEACYREGVTIFEKLVREDPGNLTYRQDLLIPCNKVGDLRLMRLGDRETCRKFYDRAMEQARWRVEKDEGSASARTDLVIQHLRAGQDALLDGRHQEALAAFERALDELARMDRQGALKEAPAYLPRPLVVKAWITVTRQAIQATGDLDYALKQGPKLVQYLLLQRVMALCNEGKHEAAAATVQKLHQAGPKDRSIQFDVARGYGRCAATLLGKRRPETLGEQERATLAGYRQQAVQALERCVELGLKDALRVECDSDLASLRQEEAFGKLVERMKKAKKD